MMATATVSTAADDDEARDSWLPMIVIAMGQMLMSFNVAALPVSMGGMVESFDTPPTTVGTAIVMYSLGVSGFIMLGAKLGQRFGSKIFFQAAVALFLVAMVTMVVSPTAEVMLAAQALAGLGGRRAGAHAGRADRQPLPRQAAGRGGRLAGLGAGHRRRAGVRHRRLRGHVISWRLAFGLLIVHAAAILLLELQAQAVRGQARGEDRRRRRDPVGGRRSF